MWEGFHLTVHVVCVCVPVSQDFVIRSQRYRPLTFGGTADRSGGSKGGAGAANARRITLIEDIPNAAFHDPAAFHAVLEAATATVSAPLVLIASNRSEDSRVLSKLFPKQVGFSRIQP